jgi:hypothetical protein
MNATLKHLRPALAAAAALLATPAFAQTAVNPSTPTSRSACSPRSSA